MKQTVFIRLLAVILLATMLLSSLVACNGDGNKETEAEETVHVDYAGEVKLDMNSDSLKKEVTVKNYIDGDTTHFNFDASIHPNGENVLKARYLAINTPESTGRVEAWGKAASNFTKEKLSAASSIIIESDNGTWNADSTGNRFLVWVWYKTDSMTDYRNLNIEILQNGLAIASNSAQNRYGDYCMNAIDQAKNEKLHVHSLEKDPDFHYGDAVEITLKELRYNTSIYNGTKVAFEGVISAVYDGSFYVEAYDEETAMYNGISVYYGTNTALGMSVKYIAAGNRVRVVGNVQIFGEAWQVSGLVYNARDTKDPNSFRLISEGNTPAYTLTNPVDFATKKITALVSTTDENGEVVETEKTFDYAALALDTSISFKDLTVTDGKQNQSNGEVTLYCKSGDTKITLFLGKLLDGNGNAITKDAYIGKTIDVKGLVDQYYENYQIRVLSANDITIH